MAHAVVAVLKTSPERVFDDYRRLLELVDAPAHLDLDAETLLAAYLAWHHFAPACNTAPWQIDGVAGALAGLGFDPQRMAVAVNGATGVSVRHGEVLNRQATAAERHGLPLIHPESDDPFVLFKPSSPMRVLDRIYPDGVPVPQRFMGANAIMLPVMRTHRDLMVAGALYSGFLAELDRRRDRAKHRFAEALVDVLAIQREIYGGMLAVMDGAFAGSGPDPRRLTPIEANLIAASSDPVALDAVTARLMGFDPTAIPALRIAAEAGLGVCNPADLDIRGDAIAEIDLNFSGHDIGESTGGVLARLVSRALPGAFAHLSMAYHDWYWYNHYSVRTVAEAMKTGWGKLFEEYRK